MRGNDAVALLLLSGLPLVAAVLLGCSEDAGDRRLVDSAGELAAQSASKEVVESVLGKGMLLQNGDVVDYVVRFSLPRDKARNRETAAQFSQALFYSSMNITIFVLLDEHEEAKHVLTGVQ